MIDSAYVVPLSCLSHVPSSGTAIVAFLEEERRILPSRQRARSLPKPLFLHRWRRGHVRYPPRYLFLATLQCAYPAGNASLHSQNIDWEPCARVSGRTLCEPEQEQRDPRPKTHPEVSFATRGSDTRNARGNSSTSRDTCTP